VAAIGILISFLQTIRCGHPRCGGDDRHGHIRRAPNPGDDQGA
jgi:hypothetical protein